VCQVREVVVMRDEDWLQGIGGDRWLRTGRTNVCHWAVWTTFDCTVPDGHAISGRPARLRSGRCRAPLPGSAIEVPDFEGWARPELGTVNSRAAGAPRAHVDALKLLAAFLQYSDSNSLTRTCSWRIGTDWGSRRWRRQRPAPRSGTPTFECSFSCHPTALLSGGRETSIVPPVAIVD
jgi:hypothetical protein